MNLIIEFFDLIFENLNSIVAVSDDCRVNKLDTRQSQIFNPLLENLNSILTLFTRFFRLHSRNSKLDIGYSTAVSSTCFSNSYSFLSTIVSYSTLE